MKAVRSLDFQGQMLHCNHAQILGITAATSIGLRAINSQGDIVGNLNSVTPKTKTLPPIGKHQAVMIVKGRLIRLGPNINDRNSYADGLNDLGQVVGCLEGGSNQSARACLWAAGQQYDLNDWILNEPEKKAVMTRAYRINNVGQILVFGYINDDEREHRQFLLTPESQTR